MPNEIDFDELDQAVNNIMDKHRGNNHDKKEPDHDEFDDMPDEGTESTDDNPKDVEKHDEEPHVEAHKASDETANSDDTDESDDSKESEVTEEEAGESVPVISKQHEGHRPVPAATRPSSGRFMDVVHPSSNMRGSQHHRPNVRPQPVKHEVVKTHDTDEEADRSNELIAELGDAATTPFLPDANEKVEKRPLGGVDHHDEDTEAEMPEKNEAHEENRADTDTEELVMTEQTEDTEAEAPEVDAVESESAEDIIDDEPTATPEQEEKELAKAGETEAASEQVAAELRAAGDIYNVSDYHKSLDQVSGRKGGVKKIFIIILIIVVFAALAVASFYAIGVGL